MINGKQKGASFERLIASKLSDWSGFDLRRTPMSGGFAKGTTSYAGDINSVNVDEKFAFSVECKNQEGWKFEHVLTLDEPVHNLWWEQCWKDSIPTLKYPLLIFTKNRTKTCGMTSVSIAETLLEQHSVDLKTLPHTLIWKSSRYGAFIIFILDEFLESYPYKEHFKEL